tara:strand:+ start:298 stop:459 length:162 start_codon:yes stop_codon:yes gene_type:complete
MTHEQALQSLVNAVAIAQKRGAYSLEEASAIHHAVLILAKPQPAEEPKKEKKK